MREETQEVQKEEQEKAESSAVTSTTARSVPRSINPETVSSHPKYAMNIFRWLFESKQAKAKRLAEEAEAKRLVEEAKAKRLAEEAEAKRLVEEARAKRLAEEAEAKRLAKEADAKRLAEIRAEAERRDQEGVANAKKLASENKAVDILVVCSVPTAYDSIEQALQDKGYQYIIFGTTFEALTYLNFAQNRVKLVIVDVDTIHSYGRRVSNGWAVAGAAKAESIVRSAKAESPEWHPSEPRVIVFSTLERELTAEQLNLYKVDFALQPFSPNTLAMAVNAVLRFGA